MYSKIFITAWHVIQKENLVSSIFFFFLLSLNIAVLFKIYTSKHESKIKNKLDRSNIGTGYKLFSEHCNMKRHANHLFYSCGSAHY